MNDAQPTAEAVAVNNGKILAVGTRAEVEKACIISVGSLPIEFFAFGIRPFLPYVRVVRLPVPLGLSTPAESGP